MSLSRNNSGSGSPLRTHASRVGSRAPSRPRTSRNSSRASISYIGQPENVVLPDGPIGEEATELLQEFIHPHHDRSPLVVDDGTEDDEVESTAASFEERNKLPWYRRPSPLWFLALVPFSSAATASTLAPKIEIFTRIVCAAMKPDYDTIGNSSVFAAPLSDDPNRHCADDPAVQAAVAQINIVLTMTLGVLTCLTTGWWGSLSDRFGRMRILSFAAFGLMITDVSFLLVAFYHKVLPGGYWFLVVGPVADGLLGGLATVSAAIHAYIADCTDANSRSRAFSLFMGLMFIGFGLGPTVGSVLIRLTGSVLSVFYVATATHIAYAFLIIFIIPESLSKRRQLEARRLRKEAIADASGLRKTVFSFLSPLALFLPATVQTGSTKFRKDWSLVYIALAYGFIVSVIGSYVYKFQYTTARFGWTSEEIGYWISVVGVTRALYLTVLLPLIIKFVNSRRKIQLPVDSDEPLTSEPLPSASTSESTSARPASSNRSIGFDYNLARISLLIEVVSYFLSAFAPTGLFYTMFTVLGAFGSGFGPAAQSIALSLYTQQGGTESGKLFGALSVVQSLSTGIIGPAVYGFIYMRTVATFAPAIFFATATSALIAFIFLSFVRIPKAGVSDVEGSLDEEGRVRHDPEETLVNDQIPIIVVDSASSKAASPQIS